MTRQAETPSKTSGALRPALLLLGLGIAVVGVALNESGVEVGRLLVMVGLVLTIVGTAVLLLRRPAAPPPMAPATPVDHRPELEALARHLSLTLNGREADGQHHGRRVSVRVKSGSAKGWARAYLSRKLDMGLRLVRGNVSGDARRRVVTGDDAFDAAYSLRADEEKRASLAVSERLRECLTDEYASVEDGYVEVCCEPNRRALAQGLRSAVKAAAELERLAAQIPCARPVRENFAAWLTFAGEHHLATASTPLSMWGEMRGVHCLAIAVRDAFESFHFELSATFPEPLERGLSVRPAPSATALDRAGEPLGIPAFDKIFVVQTVDPADTIRLVDPSVRHMLLRLRDRGLQVRADDTKLWAWVGLNRSDFQLVPETMLQLAEVASKVCMNAKNVRHT